MSVSEEPQIMSSIAIGIIILIGVIGNLFNILILSHKSMRNNSTFRFLLYLAIVDLLVLLVGTTDAFLTFGFLLFIRIHSDFICKVHTFFTYFLTHMSSFTLSIVSVDRAFIVCDQSMSTFLIKQVQRLKIQAEWLWTKRVEKIMILLGIFLGLINFHYLIFLGLSLTSEYEASNKTVSNYSSFINNYNLVQNKKTFESTASDLAKDINEKSVVCFPPANTKYNYFLIHIWTFIDVGLYSLFPFLVMVVCSVIILIEINTKSSSFLKRRTDLSNKARRRNQLLLVMLAITNGYFVLCSLPVCIDIIYYKFKGTSYEPHFLQTFFHLLAYTNNSANFIFYTIFCQKYRRIVINFFCKPNTDGLIIVRV
jgi:hypothetical protein